MNPNIERRRVFALAIVARAEIIWLTITENERAGVRFGMVPAEKMRIAEAELTAAYPEGQRDVTRLLAVALMDCAKADGGMRS